MKLGMVIYPSIFISLYNPIKVYKAPWIKTLQKFAVYISL